MKNNSINDKVPNVISLIDCKFPLKIISREAIMIAIISNVNAIIYNTHISTKLGLLITPYLHPPG